MVDYHVHLHEGLDVPGLLERSRRDGLTYGLSVNAGRQSRARTDRELIAFAEAAAGLTSFTGLQAEGGDWTRLFTPDTCARFDYVFNDGLIWTDDQGRWTRLYRADETAGLLRDPEAFMDEYVRRLADMIANQPIDLWAIPTWLPPSLEPRRAQLWTAPRVQRLIDLAARHQVAIEISDRYQIPDAAFLRQAKQAGVKLAMGTGNSSAQDLRRSEYGLRMIEECQLAWSDIFVPGAFQPIAMQRRAHLI
jgi:hypothetical protein